MVVKWTGKMPLGLPCAIILQCRVVMQCIVLSLPLNICGNHLLALASWKVLTATLKCTCNDDSFTDDVHSAEGCQCIVVERGTGLNWADASWVPYAITTTIHCMTTLWTSMKESLQMHFKVALRKFHVTDEGFQCIVVVNWTGSCPLGCLMQLLFNVQVKLS